MPARKKPNNKLVYQLKVTLRDIRPPIWRRIQVVSDMTLYELHWALQTVMGWSNSHLHEFMIFDNAYGDPKMDEASDVEDERVVKLGDVISDEKETFHYMYDFGDCWEHEILVEKILPVGKGVRYPVCVTGKRSCPPEDCGGATGYEELLAALGDTSHPDHDDLFDWLPGDFDSEKFDVEAVNRRLRPSGTRPRNPLH
ncbi:plasmid pRiA4b ORF-3 family protein [Thermodesulfobacteriota bacterium]